MALLLFVGIPLPGTGAWTGTLAASILDMKFKDVLVACMGGVLLAGIIMGLASAGLLGALSGLFAWLCPNLPPFCRGIAHSISAPSVLEWTRCV